jgi:hypothetical protein
MARHVGPCGAGALALSEYRGRVAAGRNVWQCCAPRGGGGELCPSKQAQVVAGPGHSAASASEPIEVVERQSRDTLCVF